MTAGATTAHPAELLQRLIRFDTTNPPGNEAACIAFAADLLRGAGIEPVIRAKDPARPNLIARVKGRGSAPPLLMYGHVDVVTAEGQPWRHPPFEGVMDGGFVWGRGAVDMKGGLAMMLAALLRATAAGAALPGDVILALVSDEEENGEYGAHYLVEAHAELFTGVRHAIGEIGGFSLTIGSRRLYPIMVGEKAKCLVRATVRGRGGHGSLPVRGEAMARLAHLLRQLDERRLPVHVTPVARAMFESMAAALPPSTGFIIRQLLTPSLTDGVLGLLGKRGEPFGPLLRHTVSPTIVRGGSKANVIPGEVTVDLDCRILPGFGPEDALGELRRLAGDTVELAVLDFVPAPAPTPDLTLFPALAAVLREVDPGGTPIPMLVSGATDARFFSRLGIQTYGFTPMQLPPDLNFTHLFHGGDERIPVAAVEFGTDAIYRLLQRFGAAA